MTTPHYMSCARRPTTLMFGKRSPVAGSRWSDTSSHGSSNETRRRLSTWTKESHDAIEGSVYRSARRHVGAVGLGRGDARGGCPEVCGSVAETGRRREV